jgi:hypothetical protein
VAFLLQCLCQVERERHKIFSAFLHVPRAVLRKLSNRARADADALFALISNQENDGTGDMDDENNHNGTNPGQDGERQPAGDDHDGSERISTALSRTSKSLGHDVQWMMKLLGILCLPLGCCMVRCPANSFGSLSLGTPEDLLTILQLYVYCVMNYSSSVNTLVAHDHNSMYLAEQRDVSRSLSAFTRSSCLKLFLLARLLC